MNLTDLEWAVAPEAILVMALVGLFTAALPLGLSLYAWRKTKGRWRFFLLGCVVFPLFALELEGSINRAVLYGPWGGRLASNIWIYALYGGGMAGIFEECGRWCAFRLGRRWSRGPGDALMYGAGHGGIEAVLLTGTTMLNNIVLSLALNQGGLEAVEDMTGPLPETVLAGLAALTTTPASMYLWSGLERLVAVALHVSLSVLVYAAVRRKRGWPWLAAAVGIHALVDGAAIIASAYLPIPAVEGVALVLTVLTALLAGWIFRRMGEEEENERTS